MREFHASKCDGAVRNDLRASIGVTLQSQRGALDERAVTILDALNVPLRTQVAIQPLPPFPVAQAS